jgi:hypothetical protein
VLSANGSLAMSGASRWLEDISTTDNPEMKAMTMVNRTHLFVMVLDFIYLVLCIKNGLEIAGRS